MFAVPLAMSMFASLAIAGCYQPSVGRDDLQDSLGPPTDLFDGDGGRPVDAAVPSDGRPPIDAPGGGPDAATGCDTTPLTGLTITVTTAPYGGRYQPKNIGAIWIETATGTYVKTVQRWANRRLQYLTRYNAASGGDTTDAITGATLTSHQTHTVTWNLTNRQRCEVATGNYRVVMELTDQDAPGAYATFPFTLGTTASTTNPTGTNQFKNITFNLH